MQPTITAYLGQSTKMDWPGAPGGPGGPMAPGGPGGPGTVRVDDPSENRRHMEHWAPLFQLRGIGTHARLWVDPGQHLLLSLLLNSPRRLTAERAQHCTLPKAPTDWHFLEAIKAELGQMLGTWEHTAQGQPTCRHDPARSAWFTCEGRKRRVVVPRIS